jgi:hypothetical protein
MEPQKKVGTTNPTRVVQGPSDLTKLAMLNEHISTLDKFYDEAVSKQVEKEVLVEVEKDRQVEHIPHADQAGAIFEANALTLRTIRKARLRKQGAL